MEKLVLQWEFPVSLAIARNLLSIATVMTGCGIVYFLLGFSSKVGILTPLKFK